MMMVKKFRCVSMILALALLVACRSAPPSPPVVEAGSRPEQMYMSVLAVADGDDKELDVQPLRDPQVEDLRQTAQQAVVQRDLTRAWTALQQALAITPDDPAVLQESAEVALLQARYDDAEKLALQATQLGSAVGPLCRRHWETIRQVRQKQLDLASAPVRVKRKQDAEDAQQTQAARIASQAAGVRQATDNLNTCTVSGLNRY